MLVVHCHTVCHVRNFL